LAPSNPIERLIRRLAVAGLALCAAACAGAPRNDRDWYPYLSRTTQVEMDEQRFSVTPVSDWRYAPSGPTAETYTQASYAFDDLRNVWFVLEPQPGSKLAAHTLLLFEFSNDRLLGLTIEARREVGEEYSALRGVGRAFELSYVWASARDLLVRRAVMLDHQVFVYPLAIQDDRQRLLLRRVLERTAELETTPRYYNTLFSNCTNELAKAADLDWHYAFILTGASDNHLFRQGVIPGDSFEAAEARAEMSVFLREFNSLPADADFDAALLAELRRRSAPQPQAGS